MKEPFYHLTYAGSDCTFKIYLNGILLVDNIDGVPDNAGTQLLNLFIAKKGKQLLNVELLPNKGTAVVPATAYVEIGLYAADQANDFKEKTYLIKEGTKTPPQLLLVNNVPVPKANWVVEFDAAVPYVAEAFWKNDTDISKLDQYQERIIAAYVQLYETVKEGNAFRLFESLHRSFTRINTSLYETEKGNQDNQRIIEDLIKRRPVGNRVFALQEVDFKSCKVRLYDDRRVADVLRSDGNPVLFFKAKETDTSGAAIDVRLTYVASENKFVVI
ncbi:hypothetical protein [Niabella drilacis]|uniref:Uncharacterized protein n=1 Tax=Niabella drilacis (strain DSM 25811 / CCM 8410 / CCUG 62505 / LMG 26954 / E90) TaxID=1285928 RepID=A0A1G6SP77_NIADE|nr:hypothetical protein [Niabella drilacis]SDD17916.1 hypothetical protein SAMN04487894_106282 [Niabella drilacis]